MFANQLQLARALELPTRQAMLYREPAVQNFWINNTDLITNAWSEWEATSIDSSTFTLDDTLLDKNLHEAVKQAWEDPSKELTVKALLHEVAPDVFQFQFFDPERLAVLRGYLEQVWNSQIPMRPPYGIVLNRRGAMLDSRSEGYLAAPSFQAFYNEILNTYMRPISRMLFPEVMGFDTQTFGFSIYYEPNTDSSIRPHTDASAVTLNINLNLPGEEFTGSQVDFYHPYTGDIKSLPLSLVLPCYIEAILHTQPSLLPVASELTLYCGCMGSAVDYQQKVHHAFLLMLNSAGLTQTNQMIVMHHFK